MTPSQVIRLVQGCVLLCLFGLVYWLGGMSSRTDLANYKTTVAEKTARVADLATKASELARKAEQDHAKKLEAIAYDYEQEKQAAANSAERLVADLRAGNQRLHVRWQAAQATASLSSAAASAAELDAEARDREASAARVVRAAAEADAQIRALQEIVKADRK